MRVLFLFLGLALGIAAGFLRQAIPWVIALLIACVIFLLSLKKKEAAWYGISLLLGVGIGLLGRIPHAEGTIEYEGIVIRRSENYVILWRPFFMVYCPCKDNSFQIGDVLSVQGRLRELSFTTYESRFDFGAFLESNGVRYGFDYPRIETTFSFPLRLRALEKQFLDNFSEETSSLLRSLLFSNQDDSETISALREMNLLFLWSSSGLLAGRILDGIQAILRKACDTDKKADSWFLVVLVCFLPLGLRKVGVTRVLLVRVFRYLNNHTKLFPRKLISIEILCLSGLIILLVSPYQVFQKGFLLGFGISLAFSLFGKVFERIENKKARRIASFGLVQAIVLPLAMNETGRLHLLTPVFSVLTAPLAIGFAVLGMVAFLIMPMVPFMNGIGAILSSLLQKLVEVDLSISLPPWSDVFAFLYYVVLVVALIAFESGIPSLRRIPPAVLITGYLISLFPIPPLFSQEVTFINVGQGDAILVRDRSTAVLIDTGGTTQFDLATESLIPYLRKNRIYHLDCVIASHHDYDHIGAYESLAAHFDVRAFVDEKGQFPLTIGGLRFENLNTFEADEENEASLVLKLDFMGQRWMFTGDAPEGIERQILASGADVDCDVLKVGHHGSNTSSCMPWLVACSPSVAIISVGANNHYGHPDEEVVERLVSLGIEIRRTDQEGTIRYAKVTAPWV